MSTLSGGTVSMPVKPDAKGFGAKLAESIRGETSGLGDLGKELGKKLVEGLAVVGIAASVGEFVKKGIEEYSAADALNAQFAAGIKSTGNAANLSVKGMDELAASIAGYSGQAYDSIGKTEQVLQTFTNIKNVGPNKIFDDATTAAANMAAKLGGDASASAIQLGKALNDPVKGVTALRRVGVSFTDSQTAQIKAMTASGNVMGAQKVILGELSKEFGGAAKAAGQTLPGEINRSKVAFGELSKAIVSGIMPIVAPAIGGIADLMNKATPSIEHFSEGVSEKLGEAVKVIGEDLKPVGAAVKEFVAGFKVGTDALGSSQSMFAAWGATLYGVVSQAKPVITGIIAAVKPVAATIGAAFAPLLPVIARLVPQLLGLWMSVSPVGLAFKALAPVLPTIGRLLAGLATALSGALAQALTIIVPLIGHLVSALSGVFAAIMPTVIRLVGLAASTFNTLVPVVLSVVRAVLPLVVALVGQLAPILVRLVNTVLPPVIQIFQALVPAITPLISIIVAVLIPVIKALLPVVTTVFRAIVPIIKAALQIVQGVIQVVLGVLTGNWKEAWTGIKNVLGGVWNLIVSVIRGALAILGSVIRAALTIVSAVWGAAWKGISAVASGVWNGIVGFIRGYINTVRTVISTVVGWISSFWRAEVTGWRTVITTVFHAISAVVSGAINGVRSIIADVVATIRGVWSGAWDGIVSLLSSAWARITSAVSSGVSRVLGFISGLPSRIMSALGNTGSLLYTAGANILHGLVDGIGSVIGDVIAAVTNVSSTVINVVKTILGIHSPSRVFHGIGAFLTQGLVNGITAGADAVHAAVAKLTTLPGVTVPVVGASSSSGYRVSTPPMSLLTAQQQKPVTVSTIGAAGGGATPIVNNFNGPMGYTKEQVVDQVTTKQRRALQRAAISRVASA